jgi:hypothetical protein
MMKTLALLVTVITLTGTSTTHAETWMSQDLLLGVYELVDGVSLEEVYNPLENNNNKA